MKEIRTTHAGQRLDVTGYDRAVVLHPHCTVVGTFNGVIVDPAGATAPAHVDLLDGGAEPA